MDESLQKFNPIYRSDDGWHFWDLKEEHCYGPFDSQEIAHATFIHYCETFLLETSE